MKRELTIAVLGGDGIGPEVTAEAFKVLDAVSAVSDFTVKTVEYDLGARRYNATGELLPASVLTEIRSMDAIYLGAIGDPSVTPGILERGIILALRVALDQFVNLRPVKLYPGVRGPLAGKGPDEINFIVCREGTEGPYSGIGGILAEGTEQEIATEVGLHTYAGVERVVRDAFTRATARSNKLTMVAKTNVLVHSGHLWKSVTASLAAEFPQVQTEYLHVDAAAMFFITQPERFDVVVTDNLFGDILTDVGAAICGGMGFAASANIDPTRRNPSMFEPVHGSAPDISGKGIADPAAALLSMAMLLEHLGESAAAQLVESAVATELVNRDGSAIRTTAVGDRVAAYLGTSVS